MSLESAPEALFIQEASVERDSSKRQIASDKGAFGGVEPTYVDMFGELWAGI